METRTCNGCQLAKPLSEIVFNKTFGIYVNECKLCKSTAAKKRYQETRAEVLKQRKEYYEANLSKVKQRAKQYRAKHPEKIRQYMQKYWSENGEACNKRANERYATDPKVRSGKQKSSREWSQLHPEHRRVYTHTARSKAVGGKFTPQEWQELKAKYGNKCLCCGTPEHERPLTVDHVIPISCGGPNVIANIQPLCPPCNAVKHTSATDYRTAVAA